MQIVTRFLTFKGEVIPLILDDRGLWIDANGTVYGFRDSNSSVDNSDACGVYPFRFPEGSPLDDGCKVHDYMYSSPAYQHFHTRKEADDYLMMLQLKATTGSMWRVFVLPFHFLARTFGGAFWENKDNV